jgi:PAS domain S-box-containing protein
MSRPDKPNVPWISRALAHEPDFLDVMMDTMSALVIVLDRNGMVHGFNRACQETTGYAYEEMQGEPFWEKLIPADERDGVMRVFNKLRAGEFPNQYTNFWLTRTGERRLIDWSNTAVVDADGEVDLIFGTGIDISRRYQTELRLQESEARFRLLAEASFEGLVIHDKGLILDCNRAAADMAGLTVDELRDSSAFDIIPERWHELVRESIREDRSDPYEAELVHKDGHNFPVEFQARTVPYKGRQVRVTATRDITARKAAELEREGLLRRERVARTEAERAVRARDDFLNVASHELRSPATALQLALDNILVLTERVASEPSLMSVLGKAAEVARRQSARLTNMIADLLDVTRLQSGHRTLELAEIDLGRLTRDVVERVSPLLEEEGCPVVLHADQLVVGTWDPTQLERLITNLLTNASKYGGGKQVDVGVEQEDGRARLYVQDRGIGISEVEQESIFKQYSRAVCSRRYDGVGLGLYIVQGIAEAHGGSVLVKSAPGQGARFIVELPLGEMSGACGGGG